MKRICSVLAGFAALAFAAEAQSYRCEHGELIGGEEGVSARCTVNSQGQITSVTPYQPAQRSSVTIYPNSQIRSAPAKTYSTTTKRAYAPPPLQAQPAPAVTTTRTYTTYGAHTPPPQTRIYGASNTTVYRPAERHTVSAAPSTARVRTAAYAAPCNFKVREIPTRGNINIYEVCYSDISPTDRYGLSKIYSRIRKASNRACGTDYDSVLTRWGRTNKRCVDASMDRAVMSSGLDSLRAYHLAKTGRGVPTVYVGQPRYSN